MTPQQLGRIAEDFVISHLQKLGYCARLTKRGLEIGDVFAIDPTTGEMWHIEVKAARIASDGRFHFTLWKRGHTSHRRTDVVVLLCYYENIDIAIPFVIPTKNILNQNQVTIPAIGTGVKTKYKLYRYAWRNSLSPIHPNEAREGIDEIERRGNID